MTEEQQRIAIAEACGWKPSKIDGCWNNAKRMETRDELPNYTECLNAIHEAENHLESDEKEIYWNNLYDHCDRTVFSRVEDNFIMLHLTAAQRAEAFLRTIGKWEEAQ